MQPSLPPNAEATRVVVPMLTMRYPILVVQQKTVHPQAPSKPVVFSAPKVYFVSPNAPAPIFAAQSLAPPATFHREARREVLKAKVVTRTDAQDTSARRSDRKQMAPPRGRRPALSPIAEAQLRADEYQKSLKPVVVTAAATEKAPVAESKTDLNVLATVALNADNEYYRKVSLMKSLSFSRKEVKPYERLPGRADGLTAGQALFALYSLCGNSNDNEFWFTLASNRKILPFRELRDDFNEKKLPIDHNAYHYTRRCMCEADCEKADAAPMLFDHAVFCLRYQAARSERRLWLERCAANSHSGIQEMRRIAERHGWIPEEPEDARAEIEAMDHGDDERHEADGEN